MRVPAMPAESSTNAPPATSLMSPPTPQLDPMHWLSEEIEAPPNRLMFRPVTRIEPAFLAPWVPAMILLTLDAPAVSSTRSPVVMMLIGPPLPQSELAVHPAPEAMNEPASRLTLCDVTTTDPASPDPELVTLMWLGSRSPTL